MKPPADRLALGWRLCRRPRSLTGCRPALIGPIRMADVPVESLTVARALDACANRAREALRVLEDYCRFALDDPFLSRQLKELRHDLAAALMTLPPTLLLSARDTLGDVGTNVSTAREGQRHGLRDVV